MKDDKIAIKMLTRYKEIRKNTIKKMADVEMMLGLLDVVRKYDSKQSNKDVEHGPAGKCRFDENCQTQKMDGGCSPGCYAASRLT